ncbi:MAG: hemolysin III family protein [Lentisphaerae bacterium]|jgi:hemolysin III|nr:hemolysin III family protein [Lentisphaerota bacterium]
MKTLKTEIVPECSEYTIGEEIAHSITHGLGALLGIAALVLMCVYGTRNGSPSQVVSGAIYGSSIIILYLASTIYHAIVNLRAKEILERFDHMAIYILIAGSYTPFTLVTLRDAGYPARAWTIFGIVWGITVVGIVFKAFFTNRFRVASTLAYIGMGWLVIFFIKPLWEAMPGQGIFWLILGGALYTLGTIFYLWRKVRFHHVIWHTFVLAGSITQFIAIFFWVILPKPLNLG